MPSSKKPENPAQPVDPAEEARKQQAAANAARKAEFEKIYGEASGFLGQTAVGVGRGKEVGGQAYADELKDLLVSGRATAEDAIAALKTLRLEAMASNYPTYKQNPDGTYTDTNTGKKEDEDKSEEQGDARMTLKAILSEFGLEEMADYLYKEVVGGRVNIQDRAAIFYAIRDTDSYKKRFAANARRKAAGLQELDPYSYIRVEKEYRETLRTMGLPIDFVDYADLIAGDVSNLELKERIEDGYRAVSEADPETKNALRRIYGVSESGMAAYFLDPKRGLTELKKQAEASKVAGAGFTGLGITLGKTEAENVLAMGYTSGQARAKFASEGAFRGLYQEQGTEEALSVSEKVGAAVGYDPVAAQKLERRKLLRKAQFLGGGRFTATTGATSGTAETGVGSAQ
jgi:hypothetical protein